MNNLGDLGGETAREDLVANSPLSLLRKDSRLVSELEMGATSASE